MKTRNRWRGFTLGLLLLTSSASASPLWTPLGESSGTFEEGSTVGKRNAKILIDRLRLRTVDTEGCSAIPKLEQALARVSRSIRAPRDRSDAFVRGFFSGYQQEVTQANRDVREGCGVLQHSSGSFVGSYLGAIACNGQGQWEEVTLLPFYPGWTGSNPTVTESCVQAGLETWLECSEEGDPNWVVSQLEAACGDL